MLKPILERLFHNIPAFKFIEADKIVTGFYFFYIYKDFILRELIHHYSSCGDSHQNF